MNHGARLRAIPPRLAMAVAVAAAVLALSAGSGALAGTSHHHARPATHGLNARQLAFHDGMRKLWEDHITWTRLAIVSFAGGLPDFDPTAARLLRNQAEIGAAFTPYYGARAGHRLTVLLTAHIAEAVAILKAAKSGDMAAFAQAKAAWYRNADQIAHFLHRLNPRHWPFRAVDRLMRMHLDETLKEAADRLAGKFSADIRDYEAVHHHILKMADVFSNGIMAQFPARFA